MPSDPRAGGPVDYPADPFVICLIREKVKSRLPPLSLELCRPRMVMGRTAPPDTALGTQSVEIGQPKAEVAAATVEELRLMVGPGWPTQNVRQEGGAARYPARPEPEVAETGKRDVTPRHGTETLH